MTNGGSEANNVSLWWLAHEHKNRKEIVIGLPNYMQMWGLSKAFGLIRRSFWLTERNGRWAPDLESLKDVVPSDTLAVAICNPNNPTGAVLCPDEMRAIVEIAQDAGALLLSDEVYRGA